MVTFDGLTLEPVLEGGTLREISPKYLKIPVGTGAVWTRTFSVDSRLNSEGLVEAKVGVLKTFVRDNERFMRIASSFNYWTELPMKENSHGTMRLRNIEVADFNVVPCQI